MAGRIGRFEIRRELGRGAQSVVHLAWDPQLEREVALKTLHYAPERGPDTATLLAEARSVSRLRHAGIVPVFEAGEENGTPYLAFEYVPGRSLAELMHQRGALPAYEAVTLMRGVLTALGAAHTQGIVHRDLKPSNILIDADGRPRVMDFGIARRVDDPSARQGLSGTPGYMAPEYIERREIGPQNDIYAAGVLLVELLSGRRVHREADPRRLLEHTCTNAVTLPPGGAPIDDALVAIALRAAALAPETRFGSVDAFQAALEAWQTPQVDDDSTEAARPGAMEFLLRRMKHRGDFPALSESVVAINRIASSESENVGTLSGLILRDFSLTNKLLRLVNSAQYRPAGGGQISTISRAIVVLGFDAVRNIAITVLLFEHMQNKANADHLREEFLRACLAGLFARDLAARLRIRETEQAYICAVFHNLGRLLCQFYFPEESQDIRRLMQQAGCSEEAAAVRVLGASFDELGIALARSWGFPELIQRSMEKLPADRPHRAKNAEERLCALAACANEYCDAFSQLAPAERERAMRAITKRFSDAVPLDLKGVGEVLCGAAQEIEELANVIQLDLKQTHIGRQLRQFVEAASSDEGPRPSTTEIPSTVLLEQSGPVEGAPQGHKAPDAQALLSSGIQDISNTLVEDFKLNDVLRIILETMYRAMGFKRVMLCVRDARSNSMTGRFGFGPDAGELAKKLHFSLSAHPDNVFNVATAKGVDILISDIDEPKIAPRIPEWFRKSVPSRTFVLFPLMIKGRPMALIYADKDCAGDIRISEQELALLRTLRNQAVLAIKQTG